MIFDNCMIQAPDGVNLSRCGLKKLKWYLNRNLAEIISEDPPIIRLKFEPKGREGLHDPFLESGKPNVCVVCGTTEFLTKHHIIPYCFIRHMELKYKMDIIRDIFPLCRPCHDEYEKLSQQKRSEISDRLGIEKTCDRNEYLKTKKISGAAYALLNHKESIPIERQLYLQKIITDFIGREDLVKQDLKDVLTYTENEKEKNTFAKSVAQKIDNYDEFAKEWRMHFTETMNPKFMPDAWKIDRKTESVWIPQRLLRQS